MPVKKSELYADLWKSCDALRGGMEATQYKDYILDLLFIKYISDRYSDDPDGWVRVAAPERVSDESVRLYVLSKLGWIHRQQSRFAQQARQTPRQYVDRESHYVRGERYLLRVIPHQGAGWVEIKNKGYLDLHVRPESTAEQRRRVMQDWYREQLRRKLPPWLRNGVNGCSWKELTGKLSKC